MFFLDHYVSFNDVVRRAEVVMYHQPRTLTVKNLPVATLQRWFFQLRDVSYRVTCQVILGFLRVSEISYVSSFGDHLRGNLSSFFSVVFFFFLSTFSVSATVQVSLDSDSIILRS